MNAAEPVVRLARCALAYGRGARATQALRDLSFAVRAGETLCLLGPSGCGKTSALRLAAGFARPSAGEVWIRGALAAGDGVFLPPERRRVGYVFQDLALFPHLSVAGNVAFGLRGLEAEARRARVAESLAQVGLAHKARAWPHELSGGEAQRVAIARALAPRPSALLMDEPFASLDKPLRARLREETRAILRSLDAACVFVTHDAEEAALIGDSVALMRDGRVVQQGDARALYARPVDAAAALALGDANFVPAEARAGVARAASLVIAAPRLPDGPALAMIRPEAFMPLGDATPPAGARVYEGTLTPRAFLGADALADVRVAGLEPLRARLRASALPPLSEDGAWRFMLNEELVCAFPREADAEALSSPSPSSARKEPA